MCQILLSEVSIGHLGKPPQSGRQEARPYRGGACCRLQEPAFQPDIKLQAEAFAPDVLCSVPADSM